MISHTEIAHSWAQTDSRLNLRGYAMFADGFSIFSWGRHFEIARWTETAASERVRTTQDVPTMCVLFNADGYSSSTGRHKCYTRRAIPSQTWTFTLPASIWGDHKAALAYFEAQALDSLNKASRDRTHVDMHLRKASEALDTAERYALAFAVKWTRPEASGLNERAAQLAGVLNEAPADTSEPS